VQFQKLKVDWKYLELIFLLVEMYDQLVLLPHESLRRYVLFEGVDDLGGQLGVSLSVLPLHFGLGIENPKGDFPMDKYALINELI